MGTDLCFAWEESQFQEDIIDTVGAEGDTDTTKAVKPEDTSKVVVATTARDTAHGGIEGLYFEDGSCIVGQATG